MIKFLRATFAVIVATMTMLSSQANAQSFFTTVLNANEFLVQDKAYSSPNGRYSLIFQSTDGNLVVYKGTTFTSPNALWTAKISGKGGKFAVLQPDGNFVVYKNLNDPASAVWNSGTSGVPYPNSGVYARIGNDGSFEVRGWSGTFATPKDPTAGSGSCTAPQQYAVCVFPGSAAQFNSTVFACSIAEAMNTAIATGATYGACR